MYSPSIDLKPIAIIIAVGMIALFLVGTNISNALDPVRKAEAAYQDAQTDVYVNKQSLELDQAKADLDHKRQMNSIEAQMEPARLQAEIERQSLSDRTWSYVQVILAISIGLVVIVMTAGWISTRFIAARAKLPSQQLRQGLSQRQMYQMIGKLQHQLDILEQSRQVGIPLDTRILYRTKQSEQSGSHCR